MTADRVSANSKLTDAELAGISIGLGYVEASRRQRVLDEVRPAIERIIAARLAEQREQIAQAIESYIPVLDCFSPACRSQQTSLPHRGSNGRPLDLEALNCKVDGYGQVDGR